jgi:hypothetical protein
VLTCLANCCPWPHCDACDCCHECPDATAAAASLLAVPRVYKATAEKYGEKCHMDWDTHELVVPAPHEMPPRILDLKTE